MCQETVKLEKFANESIQKQKQIEDWKEQKKLGVWEQKDATATDQVQTSARNVEADLPYQNADEKEFWQKRRQRIKLYKEAEQVSKWNRGKTKEDTDKYFVEEWKLSPRNVLENFAEVKYRLDHYPDKEGEVYKRSKEAFESSLQVLGYKCITQKNGSVELKRVSDKEKEAALKQNRIIRENLKIEIEKRCNKLADDVIHRILEEKKDHLPENPRSDELREVKKLLSSPEYQNKSEEEKKAIGQLYDGYARLTTVASNYYMRVEAMNMITDEWLSSSGTQEEKENASSIMAICSERFYDSMSKKRLLEKRADIIASGIRKKLTGEDFTEEEELVVREYVQIRGEREEARQQAEKQSTYYARAYKRKEEILKQEMVKAGMKVDERLVNSGGNRFMMFIKENDEQHNQKVIEALKLFMELGVDKSYKSKEMGRLLKPILQPLFERIRDYDVEALQGLSDEQLEQRAEEFPQWAEELQELGMLNQQLGDRGKTIDPDDPLERPIREVLCGDKMIYNYKLLRISEAALKIRSHAMLKAYKLGTLNKNSFTEREYSENVQKGKDALVGNAELLSFVRNNLLKATKMKKGNDNNRPEYESRKRALLILKRLKEFDTRQFFDRTDEMLLEHNQELQEIYESMEQVKNDVDKYSLEEEVYKQDNELWTLKRNIMYFYAKRARFLSMNKDAEEGILTQERFTESERKEIREKNGLEDGTPVSVEHMKAYIGEKLKGQKGEQERIYKDFYSDVDIDYLHDKSLSEEWKPQIHFQNFTDEMKKIKKEAEASIDNQEEPVLYNPCYDYGEELEEELTKLQESITALEQQNADAEEIRKRKKQEQEIEKKLDYLNIILEFHNGQLKYLLADQVLKDKWRMEDLKRNVESLQTSPGFAEMSDEEFFTMFKKLYAGYRKRNTATPEQIEAYREENVQGLLQYREHLLANTRYLEGIYRSDAPSREFIVPSPEYLREHWEELRNANELAQLHCNMVSDSREMFDMTKREDQELYYDIIGTCMYGFDIMTVMELGFGAFKKIKANVQQINDCIAKHRQALAERTEEEVQKEEQLNDRFRQLAQDATNILRRSKDLQGEEKRKIYVEFIDRAKELEAYVKQNANIHVMKHSDGFRVYYSPEVLRMDQIRSWNHQVQKKRAILESRLENL